MSQEIFYRGDVHWVNFPPKRAEKGSDQLPNHTLQERHPAVIISNNKQNLFSSVVTVLPITSQLDRVYPFEVKIQLDKPSKILLDQITTIDKSLLQEKIVTLTPEIMSNIEKWLHITLALVCPNK